MTLDNNDLIWKQVRGFQLDDVALAMQKQVDEFNSIKDMVAKEKHCLEDHTCATLDDLSK